jgi:hypothetical protein
VVESEGKSLNNTVQRLRGNIKKMSQNRKILNEAMTKVALINPLLSALGWDLEDPDEVAMEYRKKSLDRPVDYALLIQRLPCLFVEAKALKGGLEDRKWISQTISYAAVTGVEWCVLTNGDEYRIYNAHAPVDVEEKLFRTVQLSDEELHNYTVDTLELLSRDKVGENRLNLLWKAYFIDCRVKSCLESLFQNQSDSLVRVIKNNTDGLTSGDIRKSLERVDLKIEFPVAPPQLPTPPKPKNGETRPTATRKVSISDLLEVGLVKAPMRLEREYQGHRFEATIEENGTVQFEGKTYASPSKAGEMAKLIAKGAPPGGKRNYYACNGWRFWHFRDTGTGSLESLDKLRRLYAEMHEGVEPAKKPEVGTTYCLTPVRSSKDESNVEVVRRLLVDNGIYAFSKSTPVRNVNPGDQICFYASGVGVIAHARVKTRPERQINPIVRDAKKYPYTFQLEDAKFYPNNPVVIDVGLRQKLDAFKESDPTKHWGWFVTPTRRVTEHDYKLLTRQS